MKAHAGWMWPDVDEFMQKQQKADGTYQAGHLAAALRYVTDHTVAIDGGAHVGTWARLLSPLFARVIAVEPCADTFEALTVNMTTFGCANVECRPIALGKEAGFVSIAPLEPRAAALHNTGARFVKNGGTIRREAIDSWALPSVGFIKLDIEGSEPLAIQGARQTIARCRPIVLFEAKGFCRRFGFPADGTERELRSLNYECVEVCSKDQVWKPCRA